METSYRKLFSIVVQHEYFGGGPCIDLAVEPDADTARMMRDYRMRLRAEPGGAAIFIDSRNLSAAGLPKQPMRFVLAVEEPAVYQYTALDTKASPFSTVAVFDNLQIFQDQIQESAMLLARPGDIQHTLVDAPQSDAVQSGKAIVLDRPAAEAFGIVTIHLGLAVKPAVPTAMQALAGGEPQEPRFIIPLSSRKVGWRYLVAGAEPGAKIEASVVASGDAVSFAEPTDAEVAGRAVQVFQSSDAVPLLADPRGAYTAKLITEDGDERLLPLPSVATMKAVSGADGMVAEMMVMAERVS